MTKEAAEYAQFRDDWEDQVYAWPTGRDKEGKKLSSAHKVVLLRLIRHRNRDSGTVWVSSETLAKEANVSKSTAQEALQRAENNGLLKTITKGTGGAVGSKNRTSVREFTFPVSEPSTPVDPTVHACGPLTVHTCGPNRPRVGYLTPERTPEKEILNRTPYEGDVGEAVSVVDVDEDYFNGLFETEDLT